MWPIAIGGALVLAVHVSSHARGAIDVKAGDDLQAALDRAQPGDEIRLEAGATFTGAFTLPAKTGSEPITVRTASDGALPGPGERIGPEHARLVATIEAPDGQPALATAPRASHWHIVAVRIQGSGGGDVVRLGDGSRAQHEYGQVPTDLVLDRVIVLGDPSRGQKRGIALNSAATTIKNSYIAGIKQKGLETQAIAGWNGPGPYLIENNRLEAAGVNVLFGGAAPSIGSLVPSDITFRHNHVTKDLAWRDEPWTVKNLFELKNARRVLVDGNLFEYNWSAAQTGFAILFTVRNPGNSAPWSTVENVTFQNNIVRHVAAGVNILGFDTAAKSSQAHGILIRNNLFDDVNRERWGGSGMFLQVGHEPADVVVDHNTVLQTGNAVTAYGGTAKAPRPISGFRFTSNIVFHNQYGIFGSGLGYGSAAIAKYFPDAVIEGNVIAGGPADRYPPGNFFPTREALIAQFADYAAGDYHLTAASTFRRSTRDDQPVGASVDELSVAIAAANF